MGAGAGNNQAAAAAGSGTEHLIGDLEPVDNCINSVLGQVEKHVF